MIKPAHNPFGRAHDAFQVFTGQPRRAQGGLDLVAFGGQSLGELIDVVERTRNAFGILLLRIEPNRNRT
ncbi:MAG: hypothetical protein R3F24_13525 [Gammaproteobacteria bacterium]